MADFFQIAGRAAGTAARAGELATPHGVVPTPAFIPVGSQATVKTLTPEELEGLGVKIILCNAYHLYLRPGVEVIRQHGGLHRFMGWSGPILTDSGGYQVFSLAPFCRVQEEGVLFRSHIDGSEHFFSPERAVQLQGEMGADIIMALDEPPAYGENQDKAVEATERTHRWAERALRVRPAQGQLLFGITQGGIFPGLRRYSAQVLASLDFPGYGIGGLSLGEPKEVTWAMAEASVSALPPDKPRYLMGVGSPEDLVEGVARGIDLFDSALPTRVARNGGLFTRRGRLDITKASFKNEMGPFDPQCQCYTCRAFSAAYLHHLFRAGELLGLRLATIHNLHFMMRLMEEMRQSILSGSFLAFKEGFLGGYQPSHEETRLAEKQRWLRGKRKGS